jgi:hypothetical protein
MNAGGSSLTARSLAAAAQGVTAARVLLDSSRSCGAHVWQALFRCVSWMGYSLLLAALRQ